MRIVAAVLLCLGLLVSGCGGDGGPAPAGQDDCLVFGAGGTSGVQDRFVVGFEPGSDLADDRGARAELFAAVAASQCLAVAEVGPVLTDAVVIRTDRGLDEREQDALLRALEKHEDVQYAEPDAVATPDATPDSTPDSTLDGGSDR